MIAWWILPAGLTALIVFFIVGCAIGSGDAAFRDLVIWLMLATGTIGCGMVWAASYAVKWAAGG